jgi:acyl-[acyl-carrier-protein]-phospholipid O-acyltransferase / long-chain-fatty-acid--[acyl-carrier-protein] ligase
MLLFSRRFAPLFITQFLGALNDNLLKNALVILITFKLAAHTGSNAQMLVTLAAGLFILPYFLFSATAGQLADKYDRTRITHIVKLTEIVIMCVATLGFYTEHVNLLMVALFAMGTHSTFFGPIKYALLPQHLKDDELMAGNALIEAGTFLAILFGTITGGVVIMQTQGATLISCLLLGVAIAGYISSRYIPPAPAPSPELQFSYNIFKETLHIVQFAKANPRVFRCILGISWFWFVGATYLSQFPTFVKDTLNSDAAVVTLLLTLFSVGIGIGSALCNVLIKGSISSRFVPFAALGMALFGIDLYFASAITTDSTTLLSLEQFIAHEGSLRILFDLGAIATCAGLYIVPLYAIMQHDSDDQYRARIIAANNVYNALFMVASALATLAMLAAHMSIAHVFLITASLNIIAAAYIRRITKKHPHSPVIASDQRERGNP